MRLSTILSLALPAALFASAASAAEIKTGKDLVDACTVYLATDESAAREDPCRRFIVGFFTAFKTSEEARRDQITNGSPASATSPCVRLPDGQKVLWRDMAQRIVRYAGAHPAELTGPANDLAQHTLETEFPCPPPK